MNRRSFLYSLLGAAPAGLLAQAKSLNLKITGLKTFVVNAGSVNWVYCKIYTNQGLVGLGEGSVTSKEATVTQAIMEHERYLIGKDPTDIELLWQGMFRNPRWRGGPILNSAMAAIEIACWDIVGKALGRPVYDLLGGRLYERLPAYANAWYGAGASLAEVAKAAGEVAARGYRGLKLDPFGSVGSAFA